MTAFARGFVALVFFAFPFHSAFCQVNESADRFIGDVGCPQIMSSPVVLAELNLSNEQAKRLESLRERWSLRNRELSRRQFELPASQRDEKRVAEEAHAAIRDWQQGLSDTLREPQLQRLVQLQVQFAGAIGFGNMKVQKALNLTDIQKKEVRQCIEALDRRLRDLSRQNAAPAELLPEHAKAFERTYGMLSEPQRAAWKNLIGNPILKPFTLPKTEKSP